MLVWPNAVSEQGVRRFDRNVGASLLWRVNFPRTSQPNVSVQLSKGDYHTVTSLFLETDIYLGHLTHEAPQSAARGAI